MKEARVTIKFGEFEISEAVCYHDEQEEKVLMDLAYKRIKAEVKKQRGSFAAMLVPKGKALMQEIVRPFARVNDSLDRKDPLPYNWQQFKAWAVGRGFLSIKEISNVSGTSGATGTP